MYASQESFIASTWAYHTLVSGLIGLMGWYNYESKGTFWKNTKPRSLSLVDFTLSLHISSFMYANLLIFYCWWEFSTCKPIEKKGWQKLLVAKEEMRYLLPFKINLGCVSALWIIIVATEIKYYYQFSIGPWRQKNNCYIMTSIIKWVTRS